MKCRRKSDASRSQRNSTVLERRCCFFFVLFFALLHVRHFRDDWLFKPLKCLIFSRITQRINILFLYLLTEVALRSRVQLLIYHSPRYIIKSSPNILQLCLKKILFSFPNDRVVCDMRRVVLMRLLSCKIQQKKKNQNVPCCFKFIFSALQ